MLKLINLKHLLFLSIIVLVFSSAKGSVLKEITKQLRVKGEVEVKKNKKIVFLITNDSHSYNAGETVPEFARMLQLKYQYNVSVLLGTGQNTSYHYSKIETILDADLLIIFARRVALRSDQMKLLKQYFSSGKPVIGIRTANHAFTVREKIEDGYEDWPEFVSGILGCGNYGYGPVEPGTDVSIAKSSKNHSIIKNIKPKNWHSKGNLYLVAPLVDSTATVLLYGKVNDITQPVAWTRKAGNSKVFYTSLGFPDDFKTPQFNSLLINAIKWAIRTKK